MAHLGLASAKCHRSSKEFRSRSVDVPKRGPEGLVGQIFWDPVTFLGGTGIFVSKELIR